MIEVLLIFCIFLIFLCIYFLHEMNLISKKIDFLTKDNIPQDSLKALRSKFYKLYQKIVPLSKKTNIKTLMIFHGLILFIVFTISYFILNQFFFSVSLSLLCGFLLYFHLKAQKTLEIQKMDDHLPDFLELLGLFLKSGLSLKDGFERLHPFFKRNAPGLTYFMNQVMNDVQKGSSFLSAFQKNALFFQKSKLQEMIPYIEQADSYGTPLAQVFKTLALDMRQENLFSMEEKAQKLPAILSLPLILCFLPALLLLTFGPAFLKLSETLKNVLGP